MFERYVHRYSSVWYFNESRTGNQDLGFSHMSKDRLSMLSGLYFPSVEWACKAKITKTSSRDVASPSFLFLPWTLGADLLSLLPSFLLSYVSYKYISLIHNKSGWILDECLQSAKTTLSALFHLIFPVDQLHCFIEISIHLNHFLRCITIIFYHS